MNYLTTYTVYVLPTGVRVVGRRAGPEALRVRGEAPNVRKGPLSFQSFESINRAQGSQTQIKEVVDKPSLHRLSPMMERATSKSSGLPLLRAKR